MKVRREASPEALDAFICALKGVPLAEIPRVVKAVQAVAAARRPLRESELEAASKTKIPSIRYHRSAHQYNNDGDDIWDSADGASLLALCHGLLTLDNSGFVEFCHKGMRQFISSDVFQHQFGVQNGNEMFGAICIRHLHCIRDGNKALPSPWVRPCPSEGWKPCQLGAYAASFWHEHYLQLGTGSQLIHFLLHDAVVSSLPKDGRPNMRCKHCCNQVLATGLQMSATHNLVTIGRTYLEMSAELRPCSHSIQTTLHTATANSNPEFIRLLLEHGADPNAFAEHPPEFPEPFCTSSDADVPAALVKSGSEHLGCHCWRCCECALGQTPFHLAAARGREDAVKLLVTGGAKIDVPDRRLGETALHLAVKSGNVRVVQYLIDLDVDVCARNFAGETPLQMAIAGHHYQSAELLALNGSKIKLESCRIAAYVRAGHEDDSSLCAVRRMQSLSLEGIPPKLSLGHPGSLGDANGPVRGSTNDSELPSGSKEHPAHEEDWVLVEELDDDLCKPRLQY
jgi:hypothetical protein